MNSRTLKINDRLNAAVDPTDRLRVITALHEASHLVFAVILDAEVYGCVGVPRANGKPPKNEMSPRSQLMGYMSCTHELPVANAVISLAGWAFEHAYGEPERALLDHRDATRVFDESEMPKMELLAKKCCVNWNHRSSNVRMTYLKTLTGMAWFREHAPKKS